MTRKPDRVEFWTYRRAWAVWILNAVLCLCGGSALAIMSVVLDSAVPALIGVALVGCALAANRVILVWIRRVGARQAASRIREGRFPIL